MARIARVVVPGMSHHITRRGNRRQQTFFSDYDYAAYIDLMMEWCGKYAVDVWSYCLMPRTMKRDLPVYKSIFFRIFWLCVISFYFLEVSFIVHAAQQIDPSVERKVDASPTHFVLASDGEEINLLTTGTKKKTVQNQAWEPPPPPPDKFDWIQLTSGEWLKGNLKRLYNKKLEFDSDKLNLQEFDWKDVKQVRCHRIFSVRLVGNRTVFGILQVTENKGIVTLGDEQQIFKRDQLVSIAPSGQNEPDYWSGKINFGFNFAEGNTDELQYNAKVNLKRRTSATRFVVDYLGNITETNYVKTVNNHRIQGSLDIFKTQKYFYQPVFYEAHLDRFRNIKYSVTLGFGMGYNIIDTSRTEWRVSAGPAFQTTKFDSVQPGEASSEWTPVFTLSTHFDTELTKTIDFVFKYNLQILNDASGTYTHHSVATLETELTKWLDFDTSLVWDRTQNPTPDADGTVPKKDDFYLIFSLGIDF